MIMIRDAPIALIMLMGRTDEKKLASASLSKQAIGGNREIVRPPVPRITPTLSNGRTRAAMTITI